MKDIIQISIKTESNRWKKVPNSIYLTAEYNGINKVFVTSVLNKKMIVAILVIKYIAESEIEIIEIFFNSMQSFKCGGKNNR